MVNPDQSKTVTREVKNNDGSQTVIMEYFDCNGQKLRQSTRRRWIMFDGSMRDVSTVSLTSNGELALLVRKSSQSQSVGLRLMAKRTHRGRKELVVSQVSPSGLFARTPLSVGDTILSINAVDLCEKPDIDRAMALLCKTEGNVTVCALKSKDWIERKSHRIAQSRHLEERFTIPAPKSRSLEFDNVSYGDTFLGYRSAKKLTLRNFSSSELPGIVIESQPTQWGTLLVATDVTRSSRLSAAGLQDGDIILSIDGVDFREEPDATEAMDLLCSVDADIEIEYQRLVDNLAQAEGEATKNTNQSLRADGTKCFRTETRNPDGSILVELEEIGHPNPVDVAIEESSARLVGTSGVIEVSGWDGLTLHNTFHDQQSLPLDEVSIPACVETSSFVTNPLETVTIAVKKTSKSQNVGISLLVSKGVLYVKKISSNGLLVGKPILPGDTVIAINGNDFRRNPSVRVAQTTISNASKSVSFEILKTSLREISVIDKVDLTEKRLKKSFCCNKRADHSDEIARKLPTRQSDPPTSIIL